jgi:hypothetical protein
MECVVFAVLVALVVNHQLVQTGFLVFVLALRVAASHLTTRTMTRAALSFAAAGLVSCAFGALDLLVITEWLTVTMVALIKHVKSHVLHCVALLLSHQITHPCINCRLIDPVLVGHVVSKDKLVQNLVMKVLVSFTVHQSMCMVVVVNAVLIMALHLWVSSEGLATTIPALLQVPRLLVIVDNVLLKLSLQAITLSCWGDHHSWVFNRVFTIERVDEVLFVLL